MVRIVIVGHLARVEVVGESPTSGTTGRDADRPGVGMAWNHPGRRRPRMPWH